jgi:hypothetical protein
MLLIALKINSCILLILFSLVLQPRLLLVLKVLCFFLKVVLIQVFAPLLFVVLTPLFVIDVFLRSLEVVVVC